MTLCCKDRGNTNIKKSLTTLGQYSTPALLFLLGDRNESSILGQSSLFTKNTSTILISLAQWKQIQITFHKFKRSYLASSWGPTKDCLSHCLLLFADRQFAKTSPNPLMFTTSPMENSQTMQLKAPPGSASGHLPQAVFFIWASSLFL